MQPHSRYRLIHAATGTAETQAAMLDKATGRRRRPGGRRAPLLISRRSPRSAGASLPPTTPRVREPDGDNSYPETAAERQHFAANGGTAVERWRRPRRVNGKRFAHKAAEVKPLLSRGPSADIVILDEVFNA